MPQVKAGRGSGGGQAGERGREDSDGRIELPPAVLETPCDSDDRIKNATSDASNSGLWWKR